MRKCHNQNQNMPIECTVGSLNGIYGIKSLFPAPTGSTTESTGILLMKLAMNATSAEDLFKKKSNIIVYSISRDPEHISHTTFVQKTAVRDTGPVQKRYFSPPCMSTD